MIISKNFKRHWTIWTKQIIESEPSILCRAGDKMSKLETVYHLIFSGRKNLIDQSTDIICSWTQDLFMNLIQFLGSVQLTLHVSATRAVAPCK